jgi:hypothetical protein
MCLLFRLDETGSSDVNHGAGGVSPEFILCNAERADPQLRCTTLCLWKKDSGDLLRLFDLRVVNGGLPSAIAYCYLSDLAKATHSGADIPRSDRLSLLLQVSV